MTERRFAFFRMDMGDYLLPTNDERHCLRFRKYEEDGTAEWQDDKGKTHYVFGTYWEVLYKRMPDEGLTLTQTERWLEEGWQPYAMGFHSRKDALAQVGELVEGRVPYR